MPGLSVSGALFWCQKIRKTLFQVKEWVVLPFLTL